MTDPTSTESAFARHTAAVAEFLQELYAIMVNPVAEGEMTVEQIKKEILEAALVSREKASAVQGEAETLELQLLRRVYESSRKLLRFSGIDDNYMAEALREMDASIEKVKELDGGTMDVEFEILPRFPMSDHQVIQAWKETGEPCSYELFKMIVKATEVHHCIETPNVTKPSNEYVGSGMFKGESISQAARGWALRCHERGQEELADFLRFVSVNAASQLLSDGRAFYWRMYMLCDAYESGIGHGIQRDGHDNADGMLYGQNQECNIAYKIGYKQGDRRRAWEERKAKEATPKPFASPWGKWFPTTVLDHPMREYAPGKWETARWPSEKKNG